MKKILITGGAGFIGHHFVEHILKNTDWNIIILDRLDCSGNLNRLIDISVWEKEKHRVKFIWHDLKAEINFFLESEIGEVDYIVHLAASTHVDRSIEDPLSFVMDNVVGTCNLLNFARKIKRLEKFINFSTDEIAGPVEKGVFFKENFAHKPSNPYAASKGGQVDLGYSFHVTFGLPVITTFTMNNFGERQHPEKLVPKAIKNILDGVPMPIFSSLDKDGKLKAVGSRYWLHCRNTASAVLFLLENGKAGEEYNIIGEKEYTNLEICEMISNIIGKPLIPSFIDFHSSRPGHDIRYALDGSKLDRLGWAPPMSIEESLKKTVEWTIKNSKWLYDSNKTHYEK